jgi:hypothetical protein
LEAAKLVLREILDLGYEIREYWTVSESREMRAQAVFEEEVPVKPKAWHQPQPIPFDQLSPEEKKRVMKRKKSKFLQRKKKPSVVYPVVCFVADLGGGNYIKIMLVKRPADEDMNSELDDRWYPAFAQTEEQGGFLERWFVFHFDPEDIHAYQVPPKIIGYTESKKEFTDERLHQVEPNRRRKPRVRFQRPEADKA